MGGGTTAGPARGLYGGARMSVQRARIADAVLATRHAFTAEELHRRIRQEDGRVGLATVYRALSAMQAAGGIVTVGERGGSTLLAHCDRHDHHHHLVCTACGDVLAVDCPLGDAPIATATHGGHLVTGHEIRLYGLCAHCRSGRSDA